MTRLPRRRQLTPRQKEYLRRFSNNTLISVLIVTALCAVVGVLVAPLILYSEGMLSGVVTGSIYGVMVVLFMAGLVTVAQMENW
jgi:membrane associated rhomboid family serine protease